MPVRISKNRVALENVPLNLAAEVDVASATTTNIGAATSNNVRITGTTTITAFDNVAAGVVRLVRFASSLTLTHNSTTLKLPGGSNITTAADDRAIARSFGSGNWEIFHYQKSSGEPVVGSGNAYNLTNIIYPRADGDWRGIYRGGWRPAFFNQQWGGAQWGNLPDGSFGDVATGQIENFGQIQRIAEDGTTNDWAAQGFKVSYTDTCPAIWVQVGKTGNPTNNLQLYILPDDGSGTKPTGSTPITNGTATAQSGKLHSANTNGEWVRFVFPTPPSLSANTVYHLALKSSGAADASNYWWLGGTSTKKYPHGNQSRATPALVWTAVTGAAVAFLVEPSTKFLQPSGQFDGKLQCAEGSPLDQSKGLSQPLKNFFDGREFTYRIVTNGLTKDKTVADFVYGLDHDRIVLRCNATTGYMQVDVYESDGTKHTVTGTSDCSTGTKDIAIYVRAKGDGSDAVKLYVNGTSEGTPVTSATITFSPEFRDLGTAWIGGGFPIAPTWTKDTAMGSLPSADGWTWAQGTGTEAASMSVSGGKLYQNYNGYGATDYGYYWRTTSLSNTNGWAVIWKAKINKSDKQLGGQSVGFEIGDGTKYVTIRLQEYFIYSPDLANTPKAQINLTDREHVFTAIGKGSDFFLFVDGRLIIDGTGALTTTSATNRILFGDNDTGSGSNADVVYDYVKDYNTAWLPPQFTSGSLSESAFFSGDRTSILSSLYNGGTLKSVREYCGVEGEYVGRHSEKLGLRGITSGPTTTSTTPTLLTDMEAFAIGEEFDLKLEHVCNVNGTTIYSTVHVDGVQVSDVMSNFVPDTNYQYLSVGTDSVRVACGLHKLEGRWYVASGTGSSYGTRRHFSAGAR